MNETLKILKERRSIRSFRPEPVREEDLNAILEAGIYAPSAKNLQSTKLVVVQDRETLALLERVNAELFGDADGHPFYGAPMAVVVLSDSTYPCWLQDGALVIGNLMNAAAALGVGSCWINRAIETFERPEGKALLKKWGEENGLSAALHNNSCLRGSRRSFPPRRTASPEGRRR